MLAVYNPIISSNEGMKIKCQLRILFFYKVLIRLSLMKGAFHTFTAHEHEKNNKTYLLLLYKRRIVLIK